VSFPLERLEIPTEAPRPRRLPRPRRPTVKLPGNSSVQAAARVVPSVLKVFFVTRLARSGLRKPMS